MQMSALLEQTSCVICNYLRDISTEETLTLFLCVEQIEMIVFWSRSEACFMASVFDTADLGRLQDDLHELYQPGQISAY